MKAVQSPGVANWHEPIQFINLKKQYAAIKEAVDTGIQAVLDHGQYIMGPEVKSLERRLAEFSDARHAVCVADGTTALLVALMALEIQPGDEVITTPFTFIATSEMISLLKAVPVFVDIDPVTYNIDPGAIESAITARTKAILAVSLYGQPADFDAINKVAARHGLPVIDDAAQSYGSTYKGRPTGSLTTITCTSFFPSKPLGCYGDGGACLTDDDHLAAVMSKIRLHGQDKRYVHSMVGINGRMDTIQAAVVLAKLDIFSKEIELRSLAGRRYGTLLDALGMPDEIKAPTVALGRTSVFAQYTVRVKNREAVVDSLKGRGIPTAVHYPICLHQQNVYKSGGCIVKSVPEAELASSQVLSLPMYPGIEPELQEFIVHAMAEAVQS